MRRIPSSWPYVAVIVTVLLLIGGLELLAITALEGPDENRIIWSVKVSELPVRGKKFHVATVEVLNHGRNRVDDLLLQFRMRRDRDAQINNVVREGFFADFEIASSGQKAGRTHKAVIVEPTTFAVRCRIPNVEPGAAGKLQIVIEGKRPHLVGEPMLALASAPTKPVGNQNRGRRGNEAEVAQVVALIILVFTVGLALGRLRAEGDSGPISDLERRVLALETGRPASLPSPPVGTSEP